MHPSFAALASAVPERPALRHAITAHSWADERTLIAALRPQAILPAESEARAGALARELVQRQRASSTGGLVQNLVSEYDLSTPEGAALMEMAEALLRIPDAATRDALIKDKLTGRRWRDHIGYDRPAFVNLSAGGLLCATGLIGMTGRSSLFRGIASRTSIPFLRHVMTCAISVMGDQFVAGKSIEEALEKASTCRDPALRRSYDMLGEAAVTEEDAERYYRDYRHAIEATGIASKGLGVYKGPGISIKLSALHPRYSRLQRERVMRELLPRLTELVALAARHDIGLNIDAEEADRLELSLDLFEALARDPALRGWQGLGFVVQAYQKRAPFVLDWLIDLARGTERRLMVRLVKGAYWDSEIRRAQTDGVPGFPVYTVKAHTDIAYVACAAKMLAAPDALFPQFATHNVRTLAGIHVMAGEKFSEGIYEFQCLHGMGEVLARQVSGLNRPIRFYAPVGPHEALLAYLVRRLLENGANSSFVNQIRNPRISIDSLVADPARTVPENATNPAVTPPEALFAPARRNSAGFPIWDEDNLHRLADSLRNSQETPSGGDGVIIGNPADRRDMIGTIPFCSDERIDALIALLDQESADWSRTSPRERAAALLRAADLLEERRFVFLALLIREAGKTPVNAIAEIREAVDFLRYYATQIQSDLDSSRPFGVVACISPWNFPLAIFLGQVAASLAAGNTVLAKPAEQTPLVARKAVALLHEAGIPRNVLRLVAGDGMAGARLVADERVQGVAFTGSISVARAIQKQLSSRLTRQGLPVPLIAETGGQNAMFVDSSALPEQVVPDVLMSAFDSAGQRCSALRVLCLQEECADRVLSMLRGAMKELCVGNPARLETDIGPVIDGDAAAVIRDHIEAMRSRGFAVSQSPMTPDCADGFFIAPTLIEIDAASLPGSEIFGPVLHVLRYRRTGREALLDRLNGLGYALTFGLHTRLESEIRRIGQRSHAGNVYINRNIVGAVVGSQPFGGHGLSGTGPKAGGPLYLRRFLSVCPDAGDWRPVTPTAACRLFRAWRGAVPEALYRLPARRQKLPGPAGESNVYELTERGTILCDGPTRDDLLAQIDAALAPGNRVALSATALALLGPVPDGLREHILPLRPGLVLDAALCARNPGALLPLLERMASRDGPVVPVITTRPDGSYPIEWLVGERSISTNMMASGGNIALMNTI